MATSQQLNPLTPARGDFVVAVIDTGVVTSDGVPHEFLSGHLTDDWRHNTDHLPIDGRALGPYDGHGTFIAGLILREAPGATIHPVNVLDEEVGHGDDKSVAMAVRDLIGVPDLKVVNLSFFGDEADETSEPLEIKRALEALFASNPDVIVVTAAGNSARNAKVWPAAFNRSFERLIAVGAVDDSLVRAAGPPPKASFSNFGSWVDAYAPGVQLLGPTCWYVENIGPDGRPPQTFTGWSLWSGTSFAAATVSGRLAQAMMTGAATPQEALELVLRGPRVPIPGVAEEHWSPYVTTGDIAGRQF
jgi:subtilisin family serine protease